VLVDNLELILFSILASFMLGGTTTMLLAKQTLYSAFGFLVAMLALAGLFGLLDNRFLGVAQVMVSVGAIVVLSMLSILTINAKADALPKEPFKYLWVFLSMIIVSPFTFLLYKMLITLPHHFAKGENVSAKVMGSVLFKEWVLPFELISILLLTAMLGAILIAKKKTKGEHS